MNEFKITKKRASIALFLIDGIVLEGAIFLSEFAASHQGGQTALDLFQESTAFLPVTDNDNKFHLVNRNHVTHARLGTQDNTRSEETGLQTFAVRITFIGGDTLTGVLHSNYPRGQERLQDFLNNNDDFFELTTETHTYLVNRRLIRQVANL